MSAVEEAREALQVAMEAMALGARCVSPLWLMCIGRFPGEVVASMCGWQGALTCGGVCGCSGESALGAVEEATAEAEKHGDRSSESLAALVAEARVMIEQARAEQAERARAAAAEAATAAVKAAVAEAAAAERLQAEEEMASLALRMQQLQAQLGVVPPPAEDALCVVCLDARKDHAIVPCGHMCVCGPCAAMLNQAGHPSCPVCRGPIASTMRMFT